MIPITTKQKGMIRGAIRRLAKLLHQTEEHTTAYVKWDAGIDSIESLSKEDASVFIEHIKWLEEQINAQ